MSRRHHYGIPVPAATLDEARAMPTFLRVARINKTCYTCDACAEHRADPDYDGMACDEHTELAVALPLGAGWREHAAAELALKVLRAGGNPEPRYTSGVGLAQWTYRTPRKRADREALVLALTTERPAAVAA